MYNPALDWRDGRVVEGTPLLREHTPKKCIEGSNPSLSATEPIRFYSPPEVIDRWHALVRLAEQGARA